MYSNDIICNILEYIDININSKISIEDLEHKLYYNRYYIMKLFKKELNITIFDYINKLRIYNSLKEMNNTNNLLIKIAVDNGFYSLEYFSEIFKREIGISPREYKKIKNNRYYYNDNIITEINNNLITINNLMNKINNYKNNKKPSKLPTKKLSIFN